MLTSSVQSFMQLLGVLVIFIFVLVITYATTKWIAGYQKNQLHNKNLSIVESCKITNNKYVEIVKAGDEYLVIAIGKDEVTLLTKLSKDQLIDPDDVSDEKKTSVSESFQDVLKQVKMRFPKSK